MKHLLTLLFIGVVVTTVRFCLRRWMRLGVVMACLAGGAVQGQPYIMLTNLRTNAFPVYVGNATNSVWTAIFPVGIPYTLNLKELAAMVGDPLVLVDGGGRRIASWTSTDHCWTSLGYYWGAGVYGSSPLASASPHASVLEVLVSNSQAQVLQWSTSSEMSLNEYGYGGALLGIAVVGWSLIAQVIRGIVARDGPDI